MVTVNVGIDYVAQERTAEWQAQVFCPLGLLTMRLLSTVLHPTDSFGFRHEFG
jgi:hypothetical protein